MDRRLLLSCRRLVLCSGLVTAYWKEVVMPSDADRLRAQELSNAASVVASRLRSMLEANTAKTKSMAGVYFDLALTRWQMVCENRIHQNLDSLDAFAEEYGIMFPNTP